MYSTVPLLDTILYSLLAHSTKVQLPTLIIRELTPSSTYIDLKISDMPQNAPFVKSVPGGGAYYNQSNEIWNFLTSGVPHPLFRALKLYA